MHTFVAFSSSVSYKGSSCTFGLLSEKNTLKRWLGLSVGERNLIAI